MKFDIKDYIISIVTQCVQGEKCLFNVLVSGQLFALLIRQLAIII